MAAPGNEGLFSPWLRAKSFKWVGLLSKQAHEEYKNLLDRRVLLRAGEQSSLKLINYKRFSFGANQLAFFRK